MSEAKRVLVGENGTLGKPQFEHDCGRCVFLGHREGYDVYVCLDQGTGGDGPEMPTLIARYGEREQYYSGASFVTGGMHFRDASCAHDDPDAAARNFPPPRRRAPGEHANAPNVIAAVFVEYVLRERLFARAFKAGELAISLEARDRELANVRGMLENLRKELAVAYPTAEQVVGEALSRLGAAELAKARLLRHVAELRTEAGLAAGLLSTSANSHEAAAYGNMQNVARLLDSMQTCLER